MPDASPPHTSLPQLADPARGGAATWAHQPLRSAPGPGQARSPVRSLDLHVPFCVHKCHYCDFYSIVDTRDRQEVFTTRLEHELRALAPWASGQPLRTIFVGGGTPSLLRVDLWERLLRVLANEYDLSGIRAAHGNDGGEFTVECNPETVSTDLMACLAQGGVTRVSIGAQSFHPAHLKTLERWHTIENVPRAVELARSAGIARQSLDLIYAVPGQTLAQWDADLSAALACRTEHLSCYALTYEPNTAMTARLKKGEFTRAHDDLEADMFEHTLARLRAAGLDRYEVSNFARPGAECRHNLAYWRQEQWLAAGPSASAHVAGWRWKNIQRLDDYLSRDDQGFSAVVDVEAPDARRALGEALWTGLRTAEGVDSSMVLARAGSFPGVWERLQRVVARQGSYGALSVSQGRWQLTDAGFLVADRVAVEFLEALDPP